MITYSASLHRAVKEAKQKGAIIWIGNNRFRYCDNCLFREVAELGIWRPYAKDCELYGQLCLMSGELSLEYPGEPFIWGGKYIGAKLLMKDGNNRSTAPYWSYKYVQGKLDTVPGQGAFLAFGTPDYGKDGICSHNRNSKNPDIIALFSIEETDAQLRDDGVGAFKKVRWLTKEEEAECWKVMPDCFLKRELKAVKQTYGFEYDWDMIAKSYLVVDPNKSRVSRVTCFINDDILFSADVKVVGTQVEIRWYRIFELNNPNELPLDIDVDFVFTGGFQERWTGIPAECWADRIVVNTYSSCEKAAKVYRKQVANLRALRTWCKENINRVIKC